MMLADAGPLVAIIDRRNPYHAACVAELRRLVPPLVTLLPSLTEAMQLLGRTAGWAGQDRLWTMVARDALVVRELEPADLLRARDLMRQYQEVPMDLADATLVAYAEREDLREIFTVDRHAFALYQLRGRTSFVIIP